MSAESVNVLLVTGGSRGIGRAVAVAASDHGFDVAINYRQDMAAAEQTQRLVTERGRRAMIVQADVGVESEVVAMFQFVDQHLGRIDALVNNAGITGGAGVRVDAVTGERLRKIFETNVYGSFFCSREAVKRMSTSGGGTGGSIVNVSSIAAQRGSAGEYVDYSASKAAIETLTVGLSKEVGPEGIRVNTVSPGMTDTDIQPPGRLDSYAPMIPARRAGKPEEIAAAVVWLLSDEASYVNGATLKVSGGL